MSNLIQVKCLLKNDQVSVKIRSFINSKELQISIDSPKQEAILYDKYSRGFVSKKSTHKCNWS